MSDVKGPFYTKSTLHEYFKGVDRTKLKRWLEDYLLPACGPDGDLYAASSLDAFMADPDQFRIERRKRRGGTKITIDEVDAA